MRQFRTSHFVLDIFYSMFFVTFRILMSNLLINYLFIYIYIEFEFFVFFYEQKIKDSSTQ